MFVKKIFCSPGFNTNENFSKYIRGGGGVGVLIFAVKCLEIP